MKSYLLKIIILLTFFALYSCTFTQSYQPAFNSKKTAVIDSIKTKYGFENIVFLAKKVSNSSGKHTSLTVKFINGKAIPSDTARIRAFEQLLGSQIKTIIKDPREFNTFIILLDKMTVKGVVTNETYTGDEFKPDEL